MPVTRYRWAAVDEFRDRTAELARLDEWWSSDAREPVNLYGRRRVGKSWLFRRFAHGKPAVIVVADRLGQGQLLTSVAAQLAGPLDVVPHIPDVAALFRLLYQLGRRRKVLAVVDEFGYLLGTTAAEQQATLSSIQAVMEIERDRSQLKLVVTGSTITQMETLQAERSPLHGRLLPMALRPMPFAQARAFLATTPGGNDPVHDQVTRYSVAGGLPRILRALAGGDLSEAIAATVVDPYGALFNEPRTMLATELHEPAVYLSVLSTLAGRPQAISSIGDQLRMETKQLSKYLNVLESLQLVSRRLPVGARPEARSTQWRCDDDFVRFWFRFVQPFQAELEAGADPRAHVRLVVEPNLVDHAAPVFERLVLDWVRARTAGQASVSGGWWGPALHRRRAVKARTSEEIDAVALHGRAVVAVAEAKWTARPMDAEVLLSLLEYKLPALAQAGFDTGGCAVVLASRAGFTRGLRQLAATHRQVELQSAADIVAGPAPSGLV
jgi:uncharacterized protein